MELSWIKQLAEDSNQRELEKQEDERRKQEEERLMALATVPFVEKLYKLIQSWCDEFNKFSIYPDLRVAISRFSKMSSAQADNQTGPLEESAYFSFTRKGWLYGVRGHNGSVEFVKLSVTESASALSLNLEKMGMDSCYRLAARVEPDRNDPQKKQVFWTLNEEVMDGPRLGVLCRDFFSDFVKRTND